MTGFVFPTPSGAEIGPMYALTQSYGGVSHYLVWDGNTWVEKTKVQIKGMLFGAGVSAPNLNAQMGAVEGMVSNSPAPEAKPGELYFMNGLLKVNSMEFCKYDSENAPGKIIPIEYDPAAEAPRFKNDYLPSIAEGDPEVIEFFLSIMKYILHGGNQHEKFLILYGQGGAGKGTFLEVMNGLLEGYNTTVHGKLLTKVGENPEGPTSALYTFKGKRLAVVDELDEKVRVMNAATIKAISGRSTLSARALHRDQENFVFDGVLVFCSNKEPNFRDDAEGIDRRAVYYRMPTPKKKDLTLKDDLKGELAGILNLILAADDWDGTLPPKVQKQTDDYLKRIEGVKFWVTEFTEGCAKIKGANLTELHDAFGAWCVQEQGHSPISKGAFKEALQRMGIEPSRTNKGERYPITVVPEGL